MSIAPGYNPAQAGCTGCGTQATVTMDGRHGRRCADCPPPFDRDFALLLVALGAIDDTWLLLRTWLAAETNRRFHAAAVTL